MRNQFTPRISDSSDERLELYLSDQDRDKIKRGGDWSATVTDVGTGHKYEVKGAPCSLMGCHCDAVVVRKIEIKH